MMGSVPCKNGKTQKSHSLHAHAEEKPCEDTARRQPSTSQETDSSSETKSAYNLIRLPASRNMRNKCLLLKPLSLWHLAKALCAKTMTE